MIDPATEPNTTEPSTDEPAGGRFAQLVGAPIAPPSPIPRDAQPFQGHRAGIVTRFIADAIDFGVLLVMLGAIYAAVATFQFLRDPQTFTFPDARLAQVFFLGTIVLWVYLTIAWWLTGRSYGKHVMGLRVVNRDGARMHLVGAAARSAFCVYFPLGLFWVLVSPANRSIQDVAIRSSVIYDWSPRRNT